jgi:hypothetical protein
MAGQPEGGEAQATQAIPEGIAIITETYGKQIDLVGAGLVRAEDAAAATEARVFSADSELAAAKELSTSRHADAGVAQGVLKSQQRLMRQVKGSAIHALHNSGLPTGDTFVAQTHFEGGNEDKAREVLDRVAQVNGYLGREDARQRIIVLGSLPLSKAVGGESSAKPMISFVDLRSNNVRRTPSIGIAREEGQHYLSIEPTVVTQVAPRLQTLDPGIEKPTDRSAATRLLHEQPGDVRIVGTEDELVELVIQPGQVEQYAPDYGERQLRIGDGEEGPSLPTAIIYGPAVEKFTSILNESEYLRTLIFATLSAAAGGGTQEEIEQPEALPADSEALEKAQATFIEAVETFTKEVVGDAIEGSRFTDKAARENMWLTSAVQEYLGIDARTMLTHIARVLDPYVKVKIGNDKASTYVDMGHPNGTGLTSVDVLAYTITTAFSRKFNDDSLPSDLEQTIERRLQRAALEKELDSITGLEDRKGRKLREQLNAALNAVDQP